MDALMNAIIPAAAAKPPVAASPAKDTGNGSSFYKYVEKKVGGERQQGKNLLGVGGQRGKAAAQAKTAKTQEKAQPAEKLDQLEDESLKDASLAELLALLMQELKNVSEDIEAGPGEWTLNSSDQDLLQKLALHAGMDEEKISLLLQQMENQGGKVDLNELLASLVRHFEELGEEEPITVPETDLPLLQSFLDRLGVPPEQLEKISGDAVRGDNTFDLVKFLQGLEDLEDPKSLDGEQTIALTDWEAEQLQDILAKAGVSEQMQRELLPERIPSWLNPAAENKTVQLTLARLQELFAKGVQEVKDKQLKIDLPNFLKDLDALLAKTGFEEESVGWTPVVSDAVASIYDKLMESVDLATVRAEKAEASERVLTKQQDLKADLEEMLNEQGEASALDAEPESELLADGELASEGDEFADPAEFLEPASSRLEPGEGQILRTADDAFAHHLNTLHSEAQPANDVKVPPSPMLSRIPHQLQQQTFQTLTEGVIRGLNNNEHHLVLRLYPKELGEVKVEMMVRDDHVAVSFSMENSKVKDILQNNMDQFRDNLEKQGFVLEECMVSTGQQQDNSEDAWRQFESAWKSKQSGFSVKNVSLADLPESILYNRSTLHSSSKDGIDLFA